MAEKEFPANLTWNELRPYAGRWIAMVQNRVTGVGWTAEEARSAAKHSRPKEEALVFFVPAREMNDDAD